MQVASECTLSFSCGIWFGFAGQAPFHSLRNDDINFRVQGLRFRSLLQSLIPCHEQRNSACQPRGHFRQAAARMGRMEIACPVVVYIYIYTHIDTFLIVSYIGTF